MHIDLNCDMGESFGRYTLGYDAALLKVVTSANIACGLHAGDPLVMAQTVTLAAQSGVDVGAHPGYPDLQGFGRRAMGLTPVEIEAYVLYQISALYGFCRQAGVPLRHVKPHGALYNTAAADRDVAQAVARAVAAFDPRLIVVTLPGSSLAQAAQDLGLCVAHEGFADRAYQEDGTLVPRRQPGAVLHDPQQVLAQVVQMVTRQEVTALTGRVISLNVHTLCVHGDTPGAPEIAAQLRKALASAAITLAPLSEIVSA